MKTSLRKILTVHRHLWLDGIALTLLSSFVLGLFLGDRPLANPDEGRYAEISREMLLNWDFLTPTLNGVKYFEKPILFYWIQAFSLSCFGLTEWAGRLISCSAGVLGVLATYLFGRLFYSRITGILSSLILLTSLMYFAFAHIITIDPFFSFLFSLTLLCVLGAFHAQNPGGRRFFMYGAASFCGLAVLTKGLVAFFLPGLIIFLWVSFFYKWAQLKKLFLVSSGLLFLAWVLPWHILVSLKNPEFFDFYVIQEQFLRYFTPIHRRSQPFWFFIPVFLIGVFPWIIYIPQGLQAIWRRKNQFSSGFPKDIFLLLWIGTTLSFFSLSHSKLIPYILPVMIPTALLLGASFTLFPKPVTKSRYFLPVPFIIYGCLVALLSLLLAGAPFLSKIVQFDLNAPLCLSLKACSIFLWGPLFFYYVIPLVCSCSATLRQPISLIAGTLPLFLFASFMAQYIPYNTSSDLATFINKSLKDTPIYLYHTYPQDLPFYLNRSSPLPIVDWKGELSFGAEHTIAPWMMDSGSFAEMLKKSVQNLGAESLPHPTPICVVVKKSAREAFIQEYPQCSLFLYGAIDPKDLSSDYCLMCTENTLS